MSYTVYRINTIPSSTNAYTVGLVETWTLLPDQTFDDINQAKEYVILKNLQHSELTRLIGDLNEKEREEAIEQFCFSETDYLYLRKYFLNKPDKNVLFNKKHGKKLCLATLGR